MSKASDPPSSAEGDKGDKRRTPMERVAIFNLHTAKDNNYTIATESSSGHPSTASCVLPGTGPSSLDAMPPSYSREAGRMLLCYYSMAKSVC